MNNITHKEIRDFVNEAIRVINRGGEIRIFGFHYSHVSRNEKETSNEEPEPALNLVAGKQKPERPTVSAEADTTFFYNLIEEIKQHPSQKVGTVETKEVAQYLPISDSITTGKLLIIKMNP